VSDPGTEGGALARGLLDDKQRTKLMASTLQKENCCELHFQMSDVSRLLLASAEGIGKRRGRALTSSTFLWVLIISIYFFVGFGDFRRVWI
jgi:hypothetical protein